MTSELYPAVSRDLTECDLASVCEVVGVFHNADDLEFGGR